MAQASSMETTLERALTMLRQAKDPNIPVSNASVTAEQLRLGSSVEMANIEAMRSLSAVARLRLQNAIIEKNARRAEQSELTEQIENLLREHPTLRASKAFIDYVNGDGK